MRVERHRSPGALAEVADAWDALALATGTPYCTSDWLLAWWYAYPEANPELICLRDADGTLRAGACVGRPSAHEVRAAANVYTEHWDAVAADDAARAALWRELAAPGPRAIALPAVPAASPSVAAATDALRAARFKVAITDEQASPCLPLPASFDDLLAGVSRNLRSQVRRFTKRLQREGSLELRTSRELGSGDDLESFLELEASGWKGAARTAIRHDPQALRLYGEFARRSADSGRLRLHLLELDGVPLAADYTCVFAGGAFLVKTAFDEAYARLSPGLVLRAEALRSAIEEGLRFYDFLGGPDRYKTQWAPELRGRVLIRAYGGAAGRARYLYRHRLRPAAARGVRGARSRLGRDAGYGSRD